MIFKSMKIKHFSLILFVLIAGIFASCDKIDPPYTTQGGGGGGEPEEVIQKVLLEDYTGHKCVNCPAAAKLAGDLKEVYGDQLIIMAVHAGYFAEPENPPFDLDLRTAIGDQWDTYYNVIGNPQGLVNRKLYNGAALVLPAGWGEKVQEIVTNVTPQASISLETSFDAETRKLDVAVNSKFLSGFSEPYYLQVVLVEDSIQGAQSNNNPAVGDTPIIEDYYHRHVLRQDINGIYGDAVNGTEAIVANEVYNHNYSLTLNAAYKAQHCSVIAFLYRISDNEILQVEEKHIVD
jgi:hypothetical protein